MATAGLHQHQRKLAQLKKFPHPNPRIRALDNIVSVIAVIYPLTTLPQIYKIFSTKDAAGISLLTWVLYFILVLPLIVYGFVHKDKRLTIMWIGWALVYVAVIAGTIVYA